MAESARLHCAWLPVPPPAAKAVVAPCAREDRPRCRALPGRRSCSGAVLPLHRYGASTRRSVPHSSGGLRSNRRPTGGSPSPAPAATTTAPAPGGRTAAAMASGPTVGAPEAGRGGGQPARAGGRAPARLALRPSKDDEHP
jgi:hypothetical protein